MKMKRILLSVLALVLVAALSVGATLAFLSAEDKKVTNNFSFGGIDVQIEEEIPTEDQLPGNVTAGLDESGKGVKYSHVTPGTTLPKVPMISVSTDVKSYVFINVKGFDENLVCDGITEGWIAVDGKVDAETKNGLYYQVVESSNGNMTELASAFETVSIPTTCDGTETLPTVTIDVYAIQFDNIDLAGAVAAAEENFAGADTAA